MEKYLWSFDISLSNTGVAIFENKTLIDFFSIKTDPKKDIQYRLKQIADVLLEKRKFYVPGIAIIERGFTKFNTATQQVYRVVGLINYLFYDVEQIYFSPMTIKKVVGGDGKCSKKELQNKLLEIYPNVKFHNEDESDAVAIGLCYYLK